MKPKLCRNGHDLNAPGGRKRVGVTSTRCRLCALEKARKRWQLSEKKQAAARPKPMTEEQFVQRWLALLSQLDRCATHWERDEVKEQKRQLQAQRRLTTDTRARGTDGRVLRQRAPQVAAVAGGGA